MIRFDANLTFLFRELPLPERFAAARVVGFSGVELLVTEGAPPDTLACAAREAGVEVVLCNAPMGDFLAGGLGLSGAPGRESEFAGAIREAAALAVRSAPALRTANPDAAVVGRRRWGVDTTFRRW